MTSHISAVFFIVLSIVLNHSEGLLRRKDAAFIAAGVRSNKRRPTINSALFSAQPPPRRLLKKRKNKRRERMESAIKNKDANNNNFAVDETDEVEIRPIRRRDAVEAGLDYWIDDGDFEREKQRRIAVRNRKAMEGTISKEKLREEVVAPYKQNWIGFFSMMIVILATIITKFPEAIEIPVIKIPDL
mmetsp:Transcript_16313/g.23125  ORF Transcript_16313/g.23125 Transcript_16313/m.23125 type:complete len:187 (+) Transcript_16313:77-637(+)